MDFCTYQFDASLAPYVEGNRDVLLGATAFQGALHSEAEKQLVSI